MKILMLILKHVDLTNQIIHRLAESGVKGGTIIDGTGMANALLNMEDLPMFGMLRHILADDDKEMCKIMMFVLEDDQIDETKKIIRQVIGDLNKPNTGIMFSIPIMDVEGLGE